MHRRLHRILWVLLLGTGLLLPTGGCGGGGGSATATVPPDVSLLTGSYFWTVFAATDESPAVDEGLVQWGIATADGAGTLALTASSNESGFINPTASTSYQYTVAPDSTWAWQIGGMDVIRGGVSSDGRIAGGAVVRPTIGPAINLMIRREGTWTTGSLDGAYHMCSLRLDPISGDLRAWWGSATFDGLGGVTFAFSQNDEGLVSGPGLGGPTTYSVLADGTTTINAPTTVPLQGGILLGGDVVMVSGSTLTGKSPALVILIRESSLASTGTATGTYSLAGLSRTGGGGFSSITGPAMFDDTGNVTVTLTRNEDGAITPEPAQTVPYAVMPDGTLTVTPSAGESFVGAITPDGRFGMLAGEATSGGDPQIIFMLR